MVLQHQGAANSKPRITINTSSDPLTKQNSESGEVPTAQLKKSLQLEVAAKEAMSQMLWLL